MAVQRGGPFGGRYLDRHTGASLVREVEVEDNLKLMTSRRRCDHCDSKSLPKFIYHTHSQATRTPETMVINALSTYLSSILQSWGWAWYHCIRQGETNNGQDVLKLNESDLEGYVLFFSLVLIFFCFYIYIVLIIGLNHRFELPNTHHLILLSACRFLRQTYEARYGGFESDRRS